MMVVGCDYYPGFQQIAYVDSETGELQERRLGHPEEIQRHGVAWLTRHFVRVNHVFLNISECAAIMGLLPRC